jgi:hypothetical protein
MGLFWGLMLLFNSAISQVYIVQYDTIYITTCKRNLSYNEMAITNNFDSVRALFQPGVLTIHLGMMMVFGISGEAFIEEVKETSKSLTLITTFEDKPLIITLQENAIGKRDMIFEFGFSDTKKQLKYFPDVKSIF